MKSLLGTGKLTWNSSERRTDRYGTVRLIDKITDKSVPLNFQELLGITIFNTGLLLLKVPVLLDNT